MSINSSNIKEKITEFINDVKKDKKKMFFVILIPLVLIGTIIAGIVLNDDKSEETMADKEKALVVPVAENLEDEKSKKSDMYKRDFFDLNDDKEKSDNYFKDSSQIIVDAPVSKKSTKTYSNNTSYKSSTSSMIKKNINEINGNDDKKEYKSSSSEDKSKRSRVPSDNSGNLAFGNKKSGTNYRGVVANGNRTVKVGSYVKIRIAEDIDIDGLVLSKNSVVSGLAGISDERLSISISSVKIGSTTKSVDWTVYDEDGNFGVAIPRSIVDAIAADVSEEAIEDGGTKIEGNVPVVGSVKINLKRKAKMVEFIIPDGHRILIKKVK